MSVTANILSFFGNPMLLEKAGRHKIQISTVSIEMHGVAHFPPGCWNEPVAGGDEGLREEDVLFRMIAHAARQEDGRASIHVTIVPRVSREISERWMAV